MGWKHLIEQLLVASLFLGSTISVTADTEGVRTGLSPKSVASTATLRDKKWIHGSADCKSNKDPAIEVFQYDPSSYILRQNKCLSYEAPFIYVLLGDDRVFVLDTGATESALDFPLYETVRSLVKPGKAVEKESNNIHVGFGHGYQISA